MPINKSSSALSAIYKGSSEVTKAYLGTDQIYPNVVAPDLTVSYLVIAGGGGSGNNAGAGGGAGGYRNSFASENSGGNQSTETPLTLAVATNYNVEVGGGGSGSGQVLDGYTTGVNGNNSVFATVTSTGGGYGTIGGNVPSYHDGGAGGSGGGASAYSDPSSGSGGTRTSSPIQGFDGGDCSNSGSSRFVSNGGGGAGSQPATLSSVATYPSASGSDGRGGQGLASSITGSSVTRASGGCGGNQTTAEAGGGGAATQDGTDNTGGGAGAKVSGSGASGGSGIVILRYPDTYSITVGAGLVTSTLNTAVGTDEKYTIFTSGTGTITFN